MAPVIMWTSGLRANRPAPGTENRVYIADDTGRWYIDKVTHWENMNLSVRGDWSAAEAYETHDLVRYNGSWWLAERDNTNVTPVEGADWLLFASKGDKGDQGDQGIQGNQGDQGIQGVPGVPARTTTINAFTQPLTGANVTAEVGTSDWMAQGQVLYVTGGGYYTVNSKPDATHVVLTNTGYPGNAAGGATVAAGAAVSPGGLQGPQGPATGGVDSWGPAGNARSGDVVPELGDYSAAQVTNVPAGSITADDLQAAINELGGFYDGHETRLDTAETTISDHETRVDALEAAPGELAGVVKMWGGATAPTGYLLCDGAAVSRTTYADLFAIIGTSFGVGDSSTTFNLPDFRGRSPVGVGSMDGAYVYTMGQKAGANTHQLALAEIPGHNHTGYTTGRTAAHTHDYISPNAATAVFAAGTNRSGIAGRIGGIASTTESSDHLHGVYAEGSWGAHNSLHPVHALNFIIKT